MSLNITVVNILIGVFVFALGMITSLVEYVKKRDEEGYDLSFIAFRFLLVLVIALGVVLVMSFK